MKIVILDGFTLNPGDLSWEGFRKLGEVAVYDRTSSASEAVLRIGDAEAVYTNKTPLTEEVLSQCPGLKYIGVLATGYNVVDVSAARRRGIPVCNIPTYGTTAVSQFVFALLLEICHHVGDHARAVRNGDWERCQDFCFWNYPLKELKNKTMGIIGFGRIGQETARIALSFGMKVLAFDEYPDKTKVIDGVKQVSLESLYAESDVISLHCPLFDSTNGMINSKSIRKMKDGVILITTSRGPLIVEDELAVWLESGKRSWSAIDVVSTEPIKGSNTLVKCKNCIITPHIAWAPIESRLRLMDIAVENLKSFIAGAPVNVVNP